jgi:predicted ATPase
MEALRHAAELARTGHGQLVGAIGEPGAGKSRLFHEFKLISQSDWIVLEAFSVSHGKASAYLPVVDLLHGYFEITSDDDGRKRREKVGGKVLMLDRMLEDALPYLFSLLGIGDTPDPLAQMDDQVRKRRTLEAIKRILLRESVNQPLMLIFEDLHWIDGETQALLNLLADGIAHARILLLVNYRPEYHHEWGNRTYYNQLRLDPLGRENAEQMLASFLGDEPELGPLKRLIIERTEGNLLLHGLSAPLTNLHSALAFGSSSSELCNIWSTLCELRRFGLRDDFGRFRCPFPLGDESFALLNCRCERAAADDSISLENARRFVT